MVGQKIVNAKVTIKIQDQTKFCPLHKNTKCKKEKCGFWIPEKNCCVAVAAYYLGWDFLMRLIAHPELEKVLLEKFEELLLKDDKKTK